MIVGVFITVYHLTQLRSLSKLHCSISADIDAHNLHVIGFSHIRTERSVSTGGKNPPSVQTTARRQPRGRVSLPVRRMFDATVGHVSSDHLYFLLGFFPCPGSSLFFTFCVDGCDSLLMEHNDPMNIDTLDHSCSVILPQGAVAYCGTTAGALIRWNVR